MFECHACYASYDASGITANIDWFRKENCPSCGCAMGDDRPSVVVPREMTAPVVAVPREMTAPVETLFYI